MKNKIIALVASFFLIFGLGVVNAAPAAASGSTVCHTLTSSRSTLTVKRNGITTVLYKGQCRSGVSSFYVPSGWVGYTPLRPNGIDGPRWVSVWNGFTTVSIKRPPVLE